MVYQRQEIISKFLLLCKNRKALIHLEDISKVVELIKLIKLNLETGIYRKLQKFRRGRKRFGLKNVFVSRGSGLAVKLRGTLTLLHLFLGWGEKNGMEASDIGLPNRENQSHPRTVYCELKHSLFTIV